MNATRIGLAGLLVAAVAAGALWYGARDPAEPAARQGGEPATSPAPSAARESADAPRAPAAPRPVPSRGVAASDEASGAAGAAPPDPERERERVLDELAREMGSAALERLGDPFVQYLVENGLSRADAEQIVTTGFHASSRCTLEAMREQAQAESVALDTVFRALHAELYDADGPLLTSTIDLQAASVRAAPCSLNALQQAGIPASVAQEIQRAAVSR